MSIDTTIMSAIAARPMTGQQLVEAMSDIPERTVRMRIGYLVSQGKARYAGNDLVPHNGRPKKRKPREKAAPEAAATEVPDAPLEAAVWLDGTVTFNGGGRCHDGGVMLAPADARTLRDFLNRALPPAAVGDGGAA